MIFYKDKFKVRRLQLRYTVSELAKLCGVVKATVSRWERGINVPPKAYVKILADILNVSVAEISDMPEDKQNAFIDRVKDANVFAISNGQQLDKEEEDFIAGVKRQKEQLKKTKLVISSLMNTMHSAFYIKGITGKYVFANNEFLKIIQKTENPNIDGKTDDCFFPKNEAIQNAKLDQKVLGQRERIVNRQMHLPGTRKKKWGLITKVPIINDENNVEGMLCTIKDITKEKEANELNQELQAAISNIQDVVWTGIVVDYKLKYTTVNDATEQLLGLSKAQFIKNEWKAHIHYDFLEEVEKFLKNLKVNPRQVEYKYIHPITKKALWLQNRINIDKEHCFGIIRDITETKKIEFQQQEIVLQVLNKFDGAIKIKNSRDDAPYLYLNDGVEKIYEVSKSNFEKDLNYWRNFIPNKHKNKVFKLNRKYKEPNTDYYDTIYELQLLNGKIKRIREHFFKVKIGDEYYQCSIMNELSNNNGSSFKEMILKMPGKR